MSFVCIVCRDSLTNAPRAGQEAGVRAQEIHIVVTKCGHLYHRPCLQDWFNHRRSPIQECPYCKNVIQTNDFQRIFPTGDEDTEDINTLQNTAKNAREESEGLKTEINQLEIILGETATKLEDVNLAYDLLSYEFAQKSSELESFKKEKEEEKNMEDAIKNNLETTLQVAQKDKLVLENMLKEAENQLKLQQQQAEIDRQKRERNDRLNNHDSQNYERLFNQLKNVQEQFNSSLTINPAIAKKSSKSTSSQTDGIGNLDMDPFQGLSRSDIYKLCIEFLEKERVNHLGTNKKNDNDAYDGIGKSVVAAAATTQNNRNVTIPIPCIPIMTSTSVNVEQMCTVNQMQTHADDMNSYYDQMEKRCNPQPQPVLRLSSSIEPVETPETLSSTERLSWEAARLERQRQYYCRIINNDNGIEAD